MSKKIQYHNGRVIGELLKKIGPENAAVRIDSEWELQIYYSDRDEDSMTIEMCLYATLQGDSLYDPSMRIELDLDAKGHVKTAKPLSYWSRTPFCDIELTPEDEDLDERLDNWLNNLKQQGYFTGEVTKIE